MPLDAKISRNVYHIDRYDANSVVINEKSYSHSLLVMSDYLSDWQVESFAALTVAHFERLRALQPEVVLLGTGEKLRFPATELLAPLINAQIGVEVMDRTAACRTYNLLAGDGRKVVAALLFQ
jgi:uncharacterized protein